MKAIKALREQLLRCQATVTLT